MSLLLRFPRFPGFQVFHCIEQKSSALPPFALSHDFSHLSKRLTKKTNDLFPTKRTVSNNFNVSTWILFLCAVLASNTGNSDRRSQVVRVPASVQRLPFAGQRRDVIEEGAGCSPLALLDSSGPLVRADPLPAVAAAYPDTSSAADRPSSSQEGRQEEEKGQGKHHYSQQKRVSSVRGWVMFCRLIANRHAWCHQV